MAKKKSQSPKSKKRVVKPAKQVPRKPAPKSKPKFPARKPSKPAKEPSLKTASKPAAEPVKKSGPKPANKPVTKPASSKSKRPVPRKPSTKAARKPAPKPAPKRRALSVTPKTLRGMVSRDNDKSIAKYYASLRAAKAVREEGLSRKAAAEREGLSVTTLNRYAGSSLRKTKKGTYVKDNLPRLLAIPDTNNPRGYRFIVVRKDEVATVMAYRHAAEVFLESGDAGLLEDYEGVSVGTGEDKTTLITDRTKLKQLAEIHDDEFLEPADEEEGT